MYKKALSIKGPELRLIGILLLAVQLVLAWPVELHSQNAVTFSTLASFAVTNGSDPFGGLVLGSDGNLYGTTAQGGTNGNGTFFKLAANRVLTILFSFNGTNGSSPRGNLVPGSDDVFYGTTAQGGTNGVGTIFKVTTNGFLTTLVDFSGTNGAVPIGGLVLGNDGAFYGTTAGGGTNKGNYNNGAGTIFKITTNSSFTSLFSFNNTNGNQPVAPLTLGSDGNFYGTTFGGGTNFNTNTAGSGTVFKFALNGTLTSLVSFNSNNGAQPQAGMIQGSDGALYGTTLQGGTNNYGTIFKMTTNGTLTTLVSFNSTNGSMPYGGLIQGSDGAFYGTTGQGGIPGSGYGPGAGTIYRLTTNGTFATLFEFDNTNGVAPQYSLTQGSTGVFYGTTSQGGINNAGTVFSLNVSPLVHAVIESNNTLVLSWMALSGRTYQLQCKSSLAQTNWVNFGNTIIATNATMTVTDTISPGVVRKLYRVALLP